MEDIAKLIFVFGSLSIFIAGLFGIVWFLLGSENKERVRAVAKNFLRSPLGKRVSFFFFIGLGLLVSLIAAVAFVGITRLLFAEDDIREIDFLVVHFIDIFRPEVLTPFFETLTILGNASVVIGVLLIGALIAALRKHWSLVTLLILSVAGNQLFVFLLKQFVGRSRPSIGYQIIEVSGYSFPSGHAAVAMALYGLIWYVVFRMLKSLAWCVFWTIFSLFVIGGIAVSRVYLGVHYPSDIAAGLAFGAAWTAFLIAAYEIWGNFKNRTRPTSTLS